MEHPRYGRAVVRGGSNCQALEQAALLWGMTPQDLGDETRVWQLAGYQARHPELGELAELSMTREELAALAREKVPETVPGELPALDELHFTRNPNHGSWTVEWFDGGGVRHRVRGLWQPGRAGDAVPGEAGLLVRAADAEGAMGSKNRLKKRQALAAQRSKQTAEQDRAAGGAARLPAVLPVLAELECVAHRPAGKANVPLSRLQKRPLGGVRGGQTTEHGRRRTPMNQKLDAAQQALIDQAREQEAFWRTKFLEATRIALEAEEKAQEWRERARRWSEEAMQ